MRIGPPSHHSTRLRAARTVAILSARRESPAEDLFVTRRVEELRATVLRGAYRVDPLRVAARLYEALASGGI